MDGVLIVDKPRGPTSHTVVAQARRLLKCRKIGHAGTLDPMASGVLLLLIGEGRKLSNYLMGSAKSYLATVRFGESTDTLDAYGVVTEKRRLPDSWLHGALIEAAISKEAERREQRPPAHSAIKVAGRKAYDLARAGRPVDLPSRAVQVHSLQLLSMEASEATFELRVSKGYYVRAFARDIGEHLGVPAHLVSLRRLASGPFALNRASAWPPDPSRIESFLCSVVRAAGMSLPLAHLTAEGGDRANLGLSVDLAHFAVRPESNIGAEAWLGPQGQLLALGHRTENGFRVLRGFNFEVQPQKS